MLKQLRPLLLLSVLLWGAIANSVSAETMDKAQVQALVKAEVQKLLDSSEFMDKAIDNYIKRRTQAEARQKREQQQARAKNIRPVDIKTDHIRGNKNAPLTIVEYSDYECPFCKRFHPTVNKLLANNSDKLRWVYRHFPLGFHDPGATKQAEATECVAELGGNDAFWKYSDLIYARTKSNGKGFPISNLRSLAEEVGVNGDAFDRCFKSAKYADKVKKDIENGKLIGVTGTPAAFILNKKGDMRFVAGALPLERLQSMVDELSNK